MIYLAILAKTILAEFPRLPVLILSMRDESLYAVRSLRAGARGYVTKQEALGRVLEAVREVMDGRTYLSPKMASQVISKVVVNEHLSVTAVQLFHCRLKLFIVARLCELKSW